MPYCNAYCLHDMKRSSYGYPSATFQVTNRDDGALYVLHRFENAKVSPKIAAAVTERWNSLPHHPNTVELHHVFCAQRAVFVVHSYVPGAISLRERLHGQPLAEPVLWSCLVQVVSALQHLHTHNLAARTLDAAHVLSNHDPHHPRRLRVRLNGMGIVDVLEFETRKPLPDVQQTDIRNVGKLVMSLATGMDLSTTGWDDTVVNHCERFVAQHYSRELHNLAMTLWKAPQPPAVREVCRALGPHMWEEHDQLYQMVDTAEHALATEYDAGRSLRLLLKLGFVNERPELGPNRRWSQSGDCYILSLFRDFGKLCLADVYPHGLHMPLTHTHMYLSI